MSASSTKRWHLVAYDVRDPKRLRKTAKLLGGYGARVQYSMFSCYMSERQRERLRWELSRILKKNDDLLIFSICRDCMSVLRQHDRKQTWPPDPTGYTIV